MNRFDAFLDSIVVALPADRREGVRAELGSHLEEAYAAARASGLDETAAARRAQQQLGDARALARRLARSLWLRDLRELRGPALLGAATGLVLQLGLPFVAPGQVAANLVGELAQAGWITLFVALAAAFAARRPAPARSLFRLALLALLIEVVRIGLQVGVVFAREPEGWVTDALPAFKLIAATLQYGVFVAILVSAGKARLRAVGLREALLIPLPWLACYLLVGLPASLVAPIRSPVPQGALGWVVLCVPSILAVAGAVTAAVIAVRITPDTARAWPGVPAQPAG